MNDRASQSDVDLDALVILNEALGSYASRAGQALASIRAEFDDRRRALRDLEDVAKSEVEQRTAEYGSADEEYDLESHRQAIDQAEDRLAEVRRWIGGVESQYVSLNTRGAACGEMLQRSLPGARAFLQRRIEQLRDYNSIRLNDVAPAIASLSSLPMPPAQEAPGQLKASSAGGSRRLQDHLLPRGFRWVTLSEIDLQKQLEGVASPEDFRKVPYETMRQGLAHLKDQILPALDVDADRRPDYFRDLDRQSDRSYADGLQRVYESFFGQQDFIYFVRRQDGALDLINGRHRVKVAQDIGWEAVPAQVRE